MHACFSSGIREMRGGSWLKGSAQCMIMGHRGTQAALRVRGGSCGPKIRVWPWYGSSAQSAAFLCLCLCVGNEREKGIKRDRNGRQQSPLAFRCTWRQEKTSNEQKSLSNNVQNLPLNQYKLPYYQIDWLAKTNEFLYIFNEAFMIYFDKLYLNLLSKFTKRFIWFLYQIHLVKNHSLPVSIILPVMPISDTASKITTIKKVCFIQYEYNWMKFGSTISTALLLWRDHTSINCVASLTFINPLPWPKVSECTF